MDVSAITTLVTTVGFPIAMCVGLLYYVTKQSDKQKEENALIMQTHKEETVQFTQALNNNTLVLQRLCDKMEVEREGTK